MAHIFLTLDPHISFLGMKNILSDFFDVKSAPAWKKHSPEHSIIHTIYFVYPKATTIGINTLIYNWGIFGSMHQQVNQNLLQNFPIVAWVGTSRGMILWFDKCCISSIISKQSKYSCYNLLNNLFYSSQKLITYFEIPEYIVWDPFGQCELLVPYQQFKYPFQIIFVLFERFW